ncbi:MAG: hypothetical protein HYS19_06430 [Nitrosomonadales bacterium]|nr:hypothetical protein [Nitrosomonadales bacterium]
MPPDLLAELRKLQHQRSESSPFANHVEFHTWADKVLPLLSFDPKLQGRFKSMVSATKSARLFEIKQQEIENINSAIGMLNQAITSLEVVSVPHTAGNPTASPSNAIKEWHEKPIGKVGIGLAIAIIAFLAVYVIKSHLGLPL